MFYRIINNSSKKLFDIKPHTYKKVSKEELDKLYLQKAFERLVNGQSIICVLDKEITTENNVTNNTKIDTTNNDSNIKKNISEAVKNTKRRAKTKNSNITETIKE